MVKSLGVGYASVCDSSLNMVVAVILLAVLSGTVAALWTLAYWAPRRRIWELASKMPGPGIAPLLGNSLLFWGSMEETFDNLLRLAKEFGPVVRLWLGPRLSVLLTDVEDIKQLLGNTRIRNRDANMGKALLPFFGNGLMSNEDDTWRRHRRVVTPMFHFQILETYVEIFGRKAEVLVEKLQRRVGGQPFDIYDDLSLCTLDAICETVIGTEMNTQAAGHSAFKNQLSTATHLVHNRVLKPWLLLPWLYPLTNDGRVAKTIIKDLREFTEEVVVQKMRDFKAGVRRPGIVTASGKTIVSLLDMMIADTESQLSQQEIQDEVKTLAAGGLDTTAATMAFLLILVAIHPEVQAELHAELDAVFGGDSRPATPHDVARMPVMDRALKETLRMFPSVTMLAREVTEEIELPSGYTLPIGSSAVAMSYVVHHDEKHFPQPYRFWPDRWLADDTTADRHPYAYIPFSAGARNCVGQKYAMLQMKAVLSQVLRRYCVSTPLTMSSLRRLELSITIALGPGNYIVSLEDRKVSEPTVESEVMSEMKIPVDTSRVECVVG